MGQCKKKRRKKSGVGNRVWPWPCRRQQSLSIAVVWRLSKNTWDLKDRSFVLTHGGSPSISHRSTLSQQLFTWTPTSATPPPPHWYACRHPAELKVFHKSINVYHSGKYECFVSPALIWWKSKNGTNSFALTLQAHIVIAFVATYATIQCFLETKIL